MQNKLYQSHGFLSIDFSTFTLILDEKEQLAIVQKQEIIIASMRLSPSEYDFLTLLITFHPDYTPDRILSNLSIVQKRIIPTLRKKVEERNLHIIINRIQGIGYFLSSTNEDGIC